MLAYDAFTFKSGDKQMRQLTLNEQQTVNGAFAREICSITFTGLGMLVGAHFYPPHGWIVSMCLGAITGTLLGSAIDAPLFSMMDALTYKPTNQ